MELEEGFSYGIKPCQDDFDMSKVDYKISSRLDLLREQYKDKFDPKDWEIIEAYEMSQSINQFKKKCKKLYKKNKDKVKEDELSTRHHTPESDGISEQPGCEVQCDDK